MADWNRIDYSNLIVGEGPLWDEKNRILYTIDIRGKCIRAMKWDTGEIIQYEYPQEIGCIALTKERDILAAMTDGIYIAKPDGSLMPICVPKELKGRRFNDGKVGPDGRFYVGTTDYQHQGAFYQLDPDGTFVELFDQVGCSNGLAWSTDYRTLYYCDSPTKILEAFDFDPMNGTLSNRREVMPIPCEIGEFDGMTIDNLDRLWVAVWGSHKVLCIDPVRKEVVEEIQFPVSKVSCCGFAGEDLNTLVVTSAAFQTDLQKEPAAGNTFALELPVAGFPTYRFGERK